MGKGFRNTGTKRCPDDWTKNFKDGKLIEGKTDWRKYWQYRFGILDKNIIYKFMQDRMYRAVRDFSRIRVHREMPDIVEVKAIPSGNFFVNRLMFVVKNPIGFAERRT